MHIIEWDGLPSPLFVVMVVTIKNLGVDVSSVVASLLGLGSWLGGQTPKGLIESQYAMLVIDWRWYPQFNI